MQQTVLHCDIGDIEVVSRQVLILGSGWQSEYYCE